MTGPNGAGLTRAQRRSVLRVGLFAVALALTAPAYYLLSTVVPVQRAIPPAVVLTAMTVGLCVVFPATFAYAAWLGRHADDGDDYATESAEYGVDDHWEQQNR